MSGSESAIRLVLIHLHRPDSGDSKTGLGPK